MKLVMWLSLCGLLLVSTSVQAQLASENQGFTSMKNMLEDVLPKVVESIVQVNPQTRTIAIWQIDTAANQQLDVSRLEEQLTAALVAAKQFKRFVVIDRPGLEILAAEKGLRLLNVVDRRLMREVGEALDIDAFLYGSASLQGDSLILTLRLLDPERAAVIWGGTFDGKDRVLEEKRRKVLEEAESQLRARQFLKHRKSQTGAVLRSFFIPGLGQFYTSQNSEGISFLFVEGVAWSLVLLAELDESENDLSTQRNTGIALVAANRLVSMLHAAISADRYNQQLQRELPEEAQVSWIPSLGVGLMYQRKF